MTLEQHNFNQAGNLVGKKATRTALLKNFNLLIKSDIKTNYAV